MGQVRSASSQRLWQALMVVLLTGLSIGLAACASDRKENRFSCAISRTPCLHGTAVAALETSKGEVLIEVDGRSAPITAGNFVDLVKRGVYNGTVFHRVVKTPVPFVVQGGDPLSKDPAIPADQLGTGSYIDPATREARFIPLEIKLRSQKLPSYGEPINTPGVTAELSQAHQRGSVAMARSADPNSASSQFYIALEALPELDGRYAVFARVIRGMDVVDRIQQGDRLNRASILRGGDLAQPRP